MALRARTSDDQSGGKQTFTRAAGTIADLDGIKTSAATSTSPVVFSGGQLAGADMARMNAGTAPPRSISVTTSAQASQYATGAGNPIRITGTFKGASQSEDLLLTLANGGETIRGSKLFDTVTQIDVPAQLGTSGAMQFGTEDIGAPEGKHFGGVRGYGTGNLKVRYNEDPNTDDTLPFTADRLETILASRIIANGTSVGVTVYV